MLTVFVDTSYLRATPPTSRVYDLLEQLIARERLQVRLPWLVLEELRTGLLDSVGTALNGKGLRRTEAWSGELAAAVDEVRSSHEKWIEESVAHLVSRLSGVVEKPQSGDLDPVWRDYFAGTGAFSDRKNRKDLPDAFIREGVARYVAEHPGSRTAVLVRDAHLSEAFSKIAGVTAHSDAMELLESELERASEDRVRACRDQESQLTELARPICWEALLREEYVLAERPWEVVTASLQDGDPPLLSWDFDSAFEVDDDTLTLSAEVVVQNAGLYNPELWGEDDYDLIDDVHEINANLHVHVVFNRDDTILRVEFFELEGVELT